MARPVPLNGKTMTAMSDKLDKYSKSDYPPLGKPDIPKLVTKTKEYQAFLRTKGTERGESFKIYDEKGNFDFYAYANLIEGSYRNGELIITTSSRIFTLIGKNLDNLAELLSEKRIKAMYEFNPQTDKYPDDNKASVIEKIERED